MMVLGTLGEAVISIKKQLIIVYRHKMLEITILVHILLWLVR